MEGDTRPVYTEVASVARMALLGNFDRLLRPEDETLISRGQGRGLRLYDELERDAKAWEVLQKRILALVAREWDVTPASASRRDKKAADLVRAQLKAVGFDQMTRTMLDATMKGVSFHEVMWARDGAEIVAADVIHRKPWWFSFLRDPEADDAVFARCAVRLLTVDAPLEGVKIPAKKFVIHRFDARYNTPWGLGLGTRIFWPVFFKRQGIGFWLAFAERFGTPVPIGKYPNNATAAEKITLRMALQAFAQEGAIMVPQGMEIELLEAARSGIDTYEKLARYMDDQTAGIVLGKPGSVGSGGQLASAINTENEVRLELVKGDADLLSDTINRQIVRWIVDFNDPGAGYPTVTRDVAEPVDLQRLAETKKALFDMGFRPTLANIVEDFGGEWTEVAPPPAGAGGDPAAAAGGRSAEFASPAVPGDQAAIDAFIAGLPAVVMQQQVGGMLAAVLARLAASGDHAAALEAIVELLPDVPLDALQEALARAIFVADLWGRLAAADEAGDGA